MFRLNLLSMIRRLEREFLDDLPATDESAIASRKDLQRVNVLMRNVAIAEHAYRSTTTTPPTRIAELGAGDGGLMLQLVRRLGNGSQSKPMEITLVDQQKLVGEKTQRDFETLGCNVENVQADVFAWLEKKVPVKFDLIFANLFLHHFTEEQLRKMFELAAQQTNLFIACEPKRTIFPYVITHMLWLIGCNPVTRHDAPISIRAGFVGKELSTLWPGEHWRLNEYSAGPFTHCFVAQRI
jgi:hypothetical protein